MKKPWLNEPNHIEFRYKGYPCIIHRNNMGALCGYVGISKEHKYFRKKYDDLEESINVHGGLTYTAECNDSICHKPLPNEDDDIWWLGFDCAHYDDVVPMMDDPDSEHNILMKQFINDLFPRVSWSFRKEYRTIAYVKNEIRNMVKQLNKA